MNANPILRDEFRGVRRSDERTTSEAEHVALRCVHFVMWMQWFTAKIHEQLGHGPEIGAQIVARTVRPGGPLGDRNE